MPRQALTVLCGIVFLALAQMAAAQKFLPKSIQFKGDPEYSDEELMAAAGLKKGVVLDYAEMNDHSKLLMDSGMFASLAFKFDGQDLIFTITPSTDVYPIHLANLPLAPGAELDAKLHAMVPLYHGKVPSDGKLAEDVRAALEKLLADRGITVSVTAVGVVTSGPMKSGVATYLISNPPVLVGDVKLTGVSPERLAEVQAVVNEEAKLPFDTGSSAGNLEQVVKLYYQDRGFAAVSVHPSQVGDPAMSATGISVPYTLDVKEGRTYSIGSVSIPAESLVPQSDVDKFLVRPNGAAVQGTKLRYVWEMIARQYKSKGYLDCSVNPHPVFDDVAGTVNYTVDVTPGPVYHMGLLRFDNVSDQLRTLLLHYWELMPGDVFNQSYVSDFLMKAQTQDQTLRRTLAGVKASINASADPTTHQVNLVITLAR